MLFALNSRSKFKGSFECYFLGTHDDCIDSHWGACREVTGTHTASWSLGCPCQQWMAEAHNNSLSDGSCRYHLMQNYFFWMFFLLLFCQHFYTNVGEFDLYQNPWGARNKCRMELSVLPNFSGQQSVCHTCRSTPSANIGCSSNSSSGSCWFARGLSR